MYPRLKWTIWYGTKWASSFWSETLPRQGTLKKIQRPTMCSGACIWHVKITVANRPFYSCLLGDLAFEWQWGWRWPCFDTNFPALIMLMHLDSITTLFTQRKQWGLNQNKITSSLAAIQRPGQLATVKMIYCYDKIQVGNAYEIERLWWGRSQIKRIWFVTEFLLVELISDYGYIVFNIVPINQ